MVKSSKDSTDKTSATQFSDSVKQSAQQIWLAGLGAFAKVQDEGSKAFEALVKDGASMQRKTQAATEEKLTEVTQRVAALTAGLGSRASGQWDKLESIFEDRVARALKHLGVPSVHDIDALNARIDELQTAVDKLALRRPGPAKRTAATQRDADAAPRRPSARKSAR